MLGRDELEIHRMHKRPEFPRGLDGCKEVFLDLISDSSERVTIHQAQVGKEDSHEDWAPKQLINGDFRGNSLGIGALDLFVEPVVKVVARRTVVDETKDGKGNETRPIEWSSGDEDLERKVSRRARIESKDDEANVKHTCASTSPRAQPTNEVIALVNKGFLSRASLYAAHPGTAPPRMTRASRKSGLLNAESLRKAGFAMGCAFVKAGVGATPNARLTTAKEETKRMDVSFIVKDTVRLSLRWRCADCGF